MAVKTSEVIEVSLMVRSISANCPPIEFSVFDELRRTANALADDRQKYAAMFFCQLFMSAPRVKTANISAPKAETMTASFCHTPELSMSFVCQAAGKEFAEKYLDSGYDSQTFKAFRKTDRNERTGIMETTFALLCFNHE